VLGETFRGPSTAFTGGRKPSRLSPIISWRLGPSLREFIGDNRDGLVDRSGVEISSTFKFSKILSKNVPHKNKGGALWPNTRVVNVNIMFHKNKMGSIIISIGTFFCSLFIFPPKILCTRIYLLSNLKIVNTLPSYNKLFYLSNKKNETVTNIHAKKKEITKWMMREVHRPGTPPKK